VTIQPGTPTLERWRSQQLIWVRSFDVHLSFDWQRGDQGMLLAHGDQGGGYAVYLEDEDGAARVRFVHNDGQRLRVLDGGLLTQPGAQQLTLEVGAPGGNVWDVRLCIGDEELASEGGFPLFLSIGPFEGIDVGIDRRSPVSWDVYERFGPFPYSGRMGPVRYETGEYAADSPFKLVDVLREIGRKFE
jgi:hypothetical protein